MTRRARLGSVLALLLLVPCAVQAQGAARPVVFTDDFARDSLKEYGVKGDVTWQKGSIGLGAGGVVYRRLALGFTMEMRAVLRFARDPPHGQVTLVLLHEETAARVLVELADGKVTLQNRATLPPQTVAVAADGERVWVVRMQARYGLVQVKLWPHGRPEPEDWHSTRSLKETDFPLEAFGLVAGPGGIRVAELRVAGAPPLTLIAPQQKQLRQARKLNREVLEPHQAGKLAAAREKAEEVLAIVKAVLPADHPFLATSLNNLGLLLLEHGALDAARGHHEQALAIDKTILPPTHPVLAATLNNLGEVLRSQGKLDEARGHLEQALTIMQAILPPDDLLLAVSLNNLGALLQNQGKLAEARRHIEQAVAICRKAPPPAAAYLARSLNNLGTVLRDQRQMEEARSRSEEAVAVCRKSLPPDHPLRALCLRGLGSLLREQGKLAEAHAALQDALAVSRKALPADHPDLASSLNSVGVLLRELGKEDEARAHLEQAVAIWTKSLPPDHPYLTSGLANLGGLCWTQGQKDEAWRLYQQAQAAAARHASRLAASAPQANHGALIRAAYVRLNTLLDLAERSQPLSAARRQEVLAALVQSKGLSGSALAWRQEARVLGDDPDALALAGKIRALRQQSADLLLRGPGRERPASWRQRCLDLEAEAERLERQLARRARPYTELRRAEQAGPKEIAEQLPAGTALIEFARYRRQDLTAADRAQRWAEWRYAAVLLWRAGAGQDDFEVCFVPFGEAAPLERQRHAWRAAAQAGRVDDKLDRALRGAVWEPLAKVLPPGTKRLVVAPEGELALLPLAALRLGDGSYLLERYAVSYVGGGRDLMPRPAAQEKATSALLVADPAYDDEGAAKPPPGTGSGPGLRGADWLRQPLRFGRLPGFAREADAVAGLLGRQPGWKVDPARGAAASEEKLAAGQRPRLLYCITHGFFLKDAERLPAREVLRELELVGADSPRRSPDAGQHPRLRSGLALAGVNKWQERSAKGLSDGLLTALEVENLDLWGTELVVLSACDTGRGEVQVGEGVLGLRRAFQLAGARTVLSSLWKVPDAETERLMTDTLSRWLKGTPPHEALREAQLALIRHLRESGARNGKQGEAPPLYWAGFVCHGRAE